MHSKATAVLMRLKEMDRKYHTKRGEDKRVPGNVVSTGSSSDESPRNLAKPLSKGLASKDKPEDGGILPNTNVAEKEKEIRILKASPKSKMEVKIPFNFANGDESSISESVTFKGSPRQFSRVPRRSGKARSSTEDSKTDEVQEEETDVPSPKESLKNVSTLESIRITSKVKMKYPLLGSGDSPRNTGESSVATVLSRRADVSDTISETIKSVDESFSNESERKSSMEEAEEVQKNVSTFSNNEKNETTIEEVIRMIEEKSEIISEMSNNTLGKEEEEEEEGAVSMENVSKEEQKSRYNDDTFEEVSTSVGSTSSVEEKLKKTSEEDTVISGVKQIKITPHKQTESVQKIVANEDRDKEIVELVPPKIMQSTSKCDIGLDEELSNYVRTTENVDQAVPISLLKLSKQITTPRRHVRKSKRQRKSSNENTEEKTDSSVASEHERLTEHKENNKEDLVGAKGSSTSMKSVTNNENKSLKEASLTGEQKKEETDQTTEDKSKTDIENGDPKTISSEEKFLRETPRKSDVTSTLRKLNKDAINAIVRRHRVHTPKEIGRSSHSKNCGTVVKLPTANASRNVEDEDSDSSLENVKTRKNSSQDQRYREKKKSKKGSRSSKGRKASNYSKVEGKHSRFDCRQSHRLQKHVAAFRLQQEREDIRNYLLELERTRLEFGPGESLASSQLAAFKPLEFPKIAAFVKPDLEEGCLKSNDEIAGLQERILTIRQWLKDQYVLYRDYSSLARTVNSKYIPASLEDAKRMIRQLQRATIKSR